MLNERELGAFLRQATHSLCRLETLPAYDVPTGRGDFPRYLAGEPPRTWSARDVGGVSAGAACAGHRPAPGPGAPRSPERLRPVRLRVGLRLHVPTGDDTRILDLANRPFPAEVVGHDFWLVNHEHPVRMHYDDAGRFLGATVNPVELECYQAARDAAWRAAELFETWWDRHPEHHRPA